MTSLSHLSSLLHQESQCVFNSVQSSPGSRSSVRAGADEARLYASHGVELLELVGMLARS